MKKYIYTIAILIIVSFKLFAQLPITNTVSVENHTIMGSSHGTYVKDINGVFIPYLGSWSWSNGSEKITFTIKKITQQYLPKYSCYGDFIVADYKYVDSNGNTLIDTSLISQNSNSIYDYKIYCPSPTNGILNCSFKDVLLNKSSSILFTPVAGNPNQMSYLLVNRAQTVVVGQPFITDAFSIPNNITLTKK